MDTALVSAGYFDTLAVALLQGRTFTTADTRESPRVAIVSQAMALRFWPAGTAVGRRFRLGEWDGPEYEIPRDGRPDRARASMGGDRCRSAAG